jgi:uncharacterized membrane protein YqjE
VKNKGQNLLAFIFEAIITIFITIVLAYALIPVISELSPGYEWIFYLAIIVAIISLIVGIWTRVSRL